MKKDPLLAELPPIPATGSMIHGFEILGTDDLAEFKALGVRVRHKASGMEVYHVACTDEENLFAFGFKTLPESSNGVAHILEHSVLCGSERYPVKDPFVLLLKGSMNTFLNAFTFPDKTVYPASSTVKADLFNLMEVYGDAVWFPLLSPEMFRQEGHRLEYDDQGRLQRTGVVYNEMKGNYSTHDSVAGDWCYRSLFEGSAYHHDSGGDPAVIPSLDYEAFKAFHRSHYHPRNTQVFLYGNIPTAEWLAFLDERFMGRFDFSVLPQKTGGERLQVEAYDTPRRHVVTFPAGPESAEASESSVTLNWLLGDVRKPLNVLSWEILSELLIGSPASPLQRALVDSGLGEDLSSPSGLETELARLVFCVGLRGTDQEQAAAIESLILESLEHIASEGFDQDLVEGTLRRFEFRAREIKGGPFGLRLMRRAFRGWLHGAEPSLTLAFAPHMEAIRTGLATNPRYFEDLLKAELLSNSHRTLVTVIPDPEQNAREEAALRAELDGIDAKLSPAGKTAIREAQEALKTWQETQDSPEVLATIPFLKEEDIPRTVRKIPATLETIGASPFHAHMLYTNGIVYFDLVQDLSHLEPEELALLPLFYGMMPSLGVPGMGYEAMATTMSLVSGGFMAYPETSMCMDGSLSIRAFWRLRVLEGKLGEAWNHARRIIDEADFSDHKRILDLWAENRNEARSSILPSGNGYAALRTDRAFAPSEAIEELMRGITQIILLERSSDILGDRLGDFLEAAFVHLRQRTRRRTGMVYNATGSMEGIAECRSVAMTYQASLPPEAAPQGGLAAILEGFGGTELKELWLGTAREALAVTGTDSIDQTLEACTLPSKVAFCAQSMRGAAFGTPDYAAQTLLCHSLRTGELWESVRMKGGAYGAGAAVDGTSRILTFSSYRDPNIVSTFGAFREALEANAAQAPDERNLLLAKIGTISKELKPLAPAEAGSISLRRSLYGITEPLREQNRREMLAVKGSDISRVAADLSKNLAFSKRSVISGPDLVDKETEKHPDLLVRRTDIGPR